MAKKILVVENDEANLKMFQALLHVEGYQTIPSTNGDGFLSMVDAHRPDLIVMDIELEQRSGLDLTKELKASRDFKKIPVIAVTAFAMNGDEERILKAGCDAYLSKPIDIRQFLVTLSRYL